MNETNFLLSKEDEHDASNYKFILDFPCHTKRRDIEVYV